MYARFPVRVLSGLTALLAFADLIKPSLAYSDETSALSAAICRWSKYGPLLPAESDQRCGTLVDDATGTATGKWEPWSIHPTCAYPVEKLSSKYCVFTYSGFRGDADISILTTPEIATEAAALLEDPDPQWYKWNDPRTPPEADGVAPYELREIPGKGIGVVATRRINRGEVVLSDAAAVISMMDPPRGIVATHKRILAQKAYLQLGAKGQRQIAELSGAEDGGVEGIFNSNMFTIVLAGRQKHRGLFPEVSRINHDCTPSCYTRFSRRRLEMEAVAYRDIEPGEELSISYAPLNVQTETRRSFLFGQWGFNCTCHLCTNPEASAPSDANKQRIQDILNLMDLPENRNYEALDTFAREMVGLIRTEGLMMQLGDFYSTLARTHYEAGILGTAEKYAALAVEMLREYIGEDSEQVANAGMFLAKVRRIIKTGEGGSGD